MKFLSIKGFVSWAGSFFTENQASLPMVVLKSVASGAIEAEDRMDPFLITGINSSDFTRKFFVRQIQEGVKDRTQNNNKINERLG